MLLITAPRVVDQQVKSSLLTLHAHEQQFDIGVNRMITTHGNACAAARRDSFSGFFNRTGQIFGSRFAPDAAPSHVNGGARLGECERDAASRAATGSRNDGDFALQRSCQWTI